jgi:hypothetical protein
MPRMAEPTEPPGVKLVCGMISARKELFDAALGLLTERFGPVDLVSDVMDFDFTHYYDAEMGSPLYRRFAGFAQAIRPDALVDVKLATNALERELAVKYATGADAAARLGSTGGAAGPAAPAGGLGGGALRSVAQRRVINLDPGYIDPSKLVLASMKNFSHRIYLARGVFAEVTLTWRRTQWEALPWTFPDFACDRYHAFLTACRDRLRQQAPQEGSP